MKKKDKKYYKSLMEKTIAMQEAKVKTYNILKERGLPIPPDLKREVEGTNSLGFNAK